MWICINNTVDGNGKNSDSGEDDRLLNTNVVNRKQINRPSNTKQFYTWV
jgi:hypothetical protein